MLRTEADKKIRAAGNALLQSAARPGVVTSAANNKVVDVVRADGTAGHVVKRDSSALPPAPAKVKGPIAEKKVSSLQAVKLQEPAPPPAVAPLKPLTRPQAKSLKKKQVEVLRQSAEAASLRAHLDEATLQSQPQAVTAAERLAALRRRCGLPSQQPGPPPPPGLPTLNSAETTTWTFLEADA